MPNYNPYWCEACCSEHRPGDLRCIIHDRDDDVRDYERRLEAWKAGPDFVEGPVY